MKRYCLLLFALLLTACLAPSGDVAPQTTADAPLIIENSPTPEYTPTVNPEVMLTAWVVEQVTADIAQQPYLQALEEITDGAISQTCVDFAMRLGAFEENLSADQAQYTFSVSADGICHVTTADGAIILNAWNNEGPLYITVAGASEALGVEVVRVNADGRYGSIGDAYDAQGKRVGGVSKFLLQWEKVNADGVLPSEADPSSVPPTPVNPEQSNLYQVNYAPAIDAEAQAQAMTNLATAYENGDATAEEIDKMSFEKRKEFSIAYAEIKNKQRSPNPIIYSGEVHKINSSKNYIDPITGDYLPIDIGTTPEEQTIEMYIPRVVDNDGFTHVFYKKSWIKIEGSNNTQYDNFENFAWPDTATIHPEDPLLGIDSSVTGLTIPEAHFKAKDGYEDTMTPIFFLDEVVGQINIFGVRPRGFITGFISNKMDPFSARKIIIAEGTNLYANGIATNSGGGFVEGSDFFDKLKKNKLYYLMFIKDQKSSFIRSNNGVDKGEVTDKYSGLVPSNLTHLVITGELEDNNMLLINGQQSFIIEPND